MIRRLRQLLTRDRERGSMTPGVVVLSTGILLIIGLVVDGGRGLNAIDQAGDIAAQAAHAAGQELDLDGLSQGSVSLDSAQAVNVAQNIIAAGGATGTVNVIGDRIVIETTVTKPATFLNLIGITQVHGSGSAEVRLALGG